MHSQRATSLVMHSDMGQGLKQNNLHITWLESFFFKRGVNQNSLKLQGEKTY